MPPTDADLLAYLDKLLHRRGAISLGWEPHTVIADRAGGGWTVFRVIEDDEFTSEHLTLAGTWERGHEENDDGTPTPFAARVTFPALPDALRAYLTACPGPGMDGVLR